MIENASIPIKINIINNTDKTEIIIGSAIILSIIIFGLIIYFLLKKINE